MKKIAVIVVGAALALGGWSWDWWSPTKTPSLKIFTWSQYLPNEFIHQFERDTGVKVHVTFYSSNEEMLSKLRVSGGSYDIIQPSDYLVERMIKTGMLAPLQKESLPHLSRLEKRFYELAYDPGLKYSVPFIEGTTGLIVNRDRVKANAKEISWAMLFNSPDPSHTSFLDDMREVFAAAYIWNGADPNHPDEANLRKAQQLLRTAKKTVAAFTSEPLGLIQRAEITIAHAFSYQAMEAIRQNPKLAYVLPKEGAVQWVDTFAIPAKSQNVALAHQFIDYVLDPKHTKELQAMNHLSIVGSGVSDADRTEGSPAKLHFFHDLSEAELSRMGQGWTELKAE